VISLLYFIQILYLQIACKKIQRVISRFRRHNSNIASDYSGALSNKKCQKPKESTLEGT